MLPVRFIPTALALLLLSSPYPVDARGVWTYEALGNIWARPLVLRDGRIIVGAEDGFLYAFSPSGRLLWGHKAKKGFSGWPASLGPKAVVAGNRDGSLHVVALDGHLRNRIVLEGVPVGPPATWKRRLIQGTASGHVYAINQQGKRLWKYRGSAPVTAWPTVGKGGRIFFGCEDGSVHALKADGTLAWRTVLRAPPVSKKKAPEEDHGLLGPKKKKKKKRDRRAVMGGLVPAGDGVLLATHGGVLAALDGEGKVRWRKLLGPVVGGLSALPGGAVFGTTRGMIRAVDPQGKVLWKMAADGAVESLPRVAGGKVYIGTGRGTLYMLDLTGVPRALLSAAGAIDGGIEVVKDRILFGARDRRLYVLAAPGKARHRWSRAAALKGALKKARRGRLLWRRDLAGPVSRGVSAGAGGRLLCGTWGRKIYVHSGAGKLAWSYNCGEDIDTLPAAGYKGDILFGCGDGTFYSLTADGETRYRRPVGRRLSSSPAVARDGTVYFGARDGRLHAVSRKGKPLWRLKTGDDVDSSPRIARDGVVYVGSDDRHLYAVDPLGHISWYAITLGAIRSRPAVAPDGGIYFTSFDQKLWAVSRAGAFKWTVQTGGQILSSPTLGADGTIYFGSRDHRLYAVTPEGKVRWTYQTAGEVDSTPALGAGGTVAVGSDDGNLYVVDSKGKLAWWYPAGAQIRGGLVVQPSGAVVFGTMDGGLAAVAPPSDKAASKPTLPARVRWQVHVGMGRVGPTWRGTDGTLVVAGSDGALRAYGADGWPRWTASVGEFRLSKTLALGGHFFVTDSGGHLSCVTSEGALRFRLRVADGPVTAPGVLSTKEGALVLVGTPSGRVWAVTPAGKVRWFYAGSGAVTAPPVALGGQVVVATGDALSGVDQSGNLAWTKKLGSRILSGPAVAGPVVVVGDGLGQVMALGASGEEAWRRDLGAGVAQLVASPDGLVLMGHTVDHRLVKLSAAGTPLLEAAAPAPVSRVVPGRLRGTDYVVGVDGSVWALDRTRGIASRLLDVDTRILDARQTLSGGLLVVAGGGKVSLINTTNNEADKPTFD